MAKIAKDIVTEPISPEKVRHQIGLSPMLDTLPDRLATARFRRNQLAVNQSGARIPSRSTWEA